MHTHSVPLGQELTLANEGWYHIEFGTRMVVNGPFDTARTDLFYDFTQWIRLGPAKDAPWALTGTTSWQNLTVQAQAQTQALSWCPGCSQSVPAGLKHVCPAVLTTDHVDALRYATGPKPSKALPCTPKERWPASTAPALRCECGSQSVGSPKHSSWCCLYEK